MGKTGYTAKAKKAYKRTGAYKKKTVTLFVNNQPIKLKINLIYLMENWLGLVIIILLKVMIYMLFKNQRDRNNLIEH